MSAPVFIEHADALWPEDRASDAEWIRVDVEDILGVMMQMLRHDGHDVRRLPRRLHWLLWLLAEIDRRSTPM